MYLYTQSNVVCPIGMYTHDVIILCLLQNSCDACHIENETFLTKRNKLDIFIHYGFKNTSFHKKLLDFLVKST